MHHYLNGSWLVPPIEVSIAYGCSPCSARKATCRTCRTCQGASGCFGPSHRRGRGVLLGSTAHKAYIVCMALLGQRRLCITGRTLVTQPTNRQRTVGNGYAGKRAADLAYAHGWCALLNAIRTAVHRNGVGCLGGEVQCVVSAAASAA
jgi:hypothetical protein